MSEEVLPVSTGSSVTNEDMDNLTLWSNVVNGLSLIGALMVVVVVALSNYHNFRASKRLYFRMSMWIALSDALFCCFSFVNVDESALCPTFSFITNLCNLIYVFLTTSVSLNLHLTLLCKQTPLITKVRSHLLKESVIVYVSIGLAFLFSVPQFATAVAYDGCVLYDIFENRSLKVLALWLTVGFWEYICFIYTAVIVLLTIKKLNSHFQMMTQEMNIPMVPNSQETGLSSSHAQNHPYFQSHGSKASHQYDRRSSNSSHVPVQMGNYLRLVARRIIFYPLVPAFTQSFYILINTYFLHTDNRELIPLYLFYLVPYSAGLLNSLVFFIFDPALPDILREMKQIKRKSKNEKKSLPKDTLAANISRLEAAKSKDTILDIGPNEVTTQPDPFLLTRKDHNNTPGPQIEPEISIRISYANTPQNLGRP